MNHEDMGMIKSGYSGIKDPLKLYNALLRFWNQLKATLKNFAKNEYSTFSSLPFQCNVVSITTIMTWGVCRWVTKRKNYNLRKWYIIFTFMTAVFIFKKYLIFVSSDNHILFKLVWPLPLQKLAYLTNPWSWALSNIGHLQLMFTEVFNKFLSLLYFSIKCKVVVKRINRGAGDGLEVPMEFTFYGKDPAVKWE